MFSRMFSCSLGLLGAFAGSAVDADLLLVPCRVLVPDGAVDQREQGVIPTEADVRARSDGGAALSHQDGAGEHSLPVTSLHAQPLAGAIASVPGAAHSLLVSHRSLLRSHDVADTD